MTEVKKQGTNSEEVSVPFVFQLKLQW